MADEQESGFTFVDKRKTGDPGSGENEAAEVPEAVEATEPDTPAESPEPATGRASGSPFQLPHLKAVDRLLMCVNWLHEGAWIALGLVQDPATEKIEQDLEGARAAIDSIAFLVSKADPHVDEATRRELKNLVMDLQLNFVQQQKRAGQS
jgi:hypothetical protein